jgi:hypothetical protein
MRKFLDNNIFLFPENWRDSIERHFDTVAAISSECSTPSGFANIDWIPSASTPKVVNVEETMELLKSPLFWAIILGLLILFALGLLSP